MAICDMAIAAPSQIVHTLLLKQWPFSVFGGINWISSLSLTQRRGFLGVTEIHEAEKELEKKKKKENKNKSSKVSQNPLLRKENSQTK